MATDITIAGTSVDFGGDWEIRVPTSPVDVAPSATVTTTAAETIVPDDVLEITIDNTVVFSGRTRSGGTKSTGGGTRVQAAHPAREFFEEDVSLSLTTPTAEEVLNATLSEANAGSQFTLSYLGSNPTLNDDYNVTDRSVKRVWQDMMDRADNLWWVDPATNFITVNGRGAGGLWKAIDTTADSAAIRQYDSGNIDTVRNVVTVVAAGGTGIRATFQDATSINTYGRRPAEEPYKVSYIESFGEVDAMAQQLLIPDPLPEGTLQVGSNVGDVTQPLVNQTLDITDAGLNIDADGLIIEQQTIQQDSATIQFGGGQGTSIENRNRTTKSRTDNAPPGAIIDNERLGEDSVDTEQLVDAAVIENKLEDLSVSLQKVQDGAVSEQKLQDLAVSLQKVQDGAIDTVKITDNAIQTPKLESEAVTAAKILAGTITATEISADTITANEIAAGTITATEILADTITANEIAADTITALEIAADTLTANEIDTLDLDTDELSVQTPSGDSELTFLTESSGGVNPADILRIVPSGTEAVATLGTPSTLFANLYASSADIDNIQPATTNASQLGSLSTSYDNAYVDTVNADKVIPLNGNDTGNVGVTGDYFNGMRANAFFEESPEPIAEEDIDLVELAALSDPWYDPPEYIRRESARKEVEAEGDGDVSADGLGDPAGLELGTVANYLLGVCQQQQERIDDLEQRLTRLEEQV